jgi:AraC-like DNA-binding protein
MENEYHDIYIYERIVKAKLFIDRHYGEKIDLDIISDEACFSKFHFIRLFKSIYGKTPYQYLIAVRIENAKLLLQKGYTVMRTCMEVGFESDTSFTNLFRQMVSMSPSKYQEQQVTRQEQLKTEPLQFIPGCFAQQWF